MEISDEFYLDLAINEAWKYQGLTYPNPAVGCVILSKNGEILSIQAHESSGSSHAELSATKQALLKINPHFEFSQNPEKLYYEIFKNHKNLLKDSIFYVTLEPCAHHGKTPACSDLLIELGIKRVVIGTKDNNKIASGGAQKLKKANIEVVFGVCESKCKELLLPFLLWNKQKFLFFKLALRLDGSFDNGAISSESSRKWMHSLRDCCDLLVVGGNTVRVDRPTLDARMINGKAPDILICTTKEVDKTIPLFDVKNRKVMFQNNLDIPKEYKNVMIEGGNNFLNSFKNFADMFLVFRNSNFQDKSVKTANLNLDLKLLHTFNIENDIISWYIKA